METYPRQAGATNGFRNGVPRSFRVTTGAVYYLRSADSRSSALQLHRWDRTDGTTEVILSGASGAALSAAELAMRERLRESASGITAFDVRGDHVVANAGGELLLWDPHGPESGPSPLAPSTRGSAPMADWWPGLSRVA